MHDDRQRDRIPLLASHFDRRLDHIAKHVTWHGLVLLGLFQELRTARKAPIIVRSKREINELDAGVQKA
jgi:hypothetical protein